MLRSKGPGVCKESSATAQRQTYASSAQFDHFAEVEGVAFEVHCVPLLVDLLDAAHELRWRRSLSVDLTTKKKHLYIGIVLDETVSDMAMIYCNLIIRQSLIRIYIIHSLPLGKWFFSWQSKVI